MGKHKGLWFDEVLAKEPDYCIWAMRLKEPSTGFHKFINWLRVVKVFIFKKQEAILITYSHIDMHQMTAKHNLTQKWIYKSIMDLKKMKEASQKWTY